MTDDPSTLVSTDWLEARLGDPSLRILDASWYMPDANRDPRAEHQAAHIPGAQFFDIDTIADTRSGLPHMAPSADLFASRMRALGIGDGHQVVVYDGTGLFSAARVWWLFRYMGHDKVAVLDGGFPKWQAEARPVSHAAETPRPRHFTPALQPGLIADVTAVSGAVKLRDRQIVDARAPARFTADEAEPRAGLASGHMPGARNLFFGALVNPDGTMKDPADLRTALKAAGVDLDRPVITTCGSGVTAAIINLALERLGHTDHALYDGSWAEWGSFPGLPVATGEA